VSSVSPLRHHELVPFGIDARGEVQFLFAGLIERTGQFPAAGEEPFDAFPEIVEMEAQTGPGALALTIAMLNPHHPTPVGDSWAGGLEKEILCSPPPGPGRGKTSIKIRPAGAFSYEFEKFRPTNAKCVDSSPGRWQHVSASMAKRVGWRAITALANTKN
jgi:hypothetical protein